MMVSLLFNSTCADSHAICVWIETSGIFRGILAGLKPFGRRFSCSDLVNVSLLNCARVSALATLRKMRKLGTLSCEMRVILFVSTVLVVVLASSGVSVAAEVDGDGDLVVFVTSQLRAETDVALTTAGPFLPGSSMRGFFGGFSICEGLGMLVLWCRLIQCCV